MAVRNFINFYISDLGKLARKNPSDIDLLNGILDELTFRKSSQARRELTEEIHNFLSQPPQPPKCPIIKARALTSAYTIKELNEQIFEPDTLLKDIRLPTNLQMLQKTMLRDNAQLSLKFLLEIRSHGIYPRDQIVRLQLFCKQRLPKLTILQNTSVNVDDASHAVKLRRLEFSQSEKNRLTGKFYTSEIPKSYRRAVLNTTYIHDFRKERLLSTYLSGISTSNAAAIRGVIDFFLHSKVATQLTHSVENKTATAVINSVKEKEDVKLDDKGLEDIIAEIKTDQSRKIETVTCTNKSDFYQAELDKCVILSAPPGCGKTFSIMERLVHHAMVLNEPFGPKRILVLSFTRNAVKELKVRLERQNQMDLLGNLDLIRVMTFDALAYSILMASDSGQPDDDFDSNIRKAKSLIIQGKIAGVGVLNTVKWIYVDEYQDLVGCRADFTLELMKLVLARGGAVSLLGDPCQQIMNFQLKHRNDTTNDVFLREFKRLAAKRLLKVRLSESYRFITVEQKERVKKLTEQLMSAQFAEITSHDYAPVVSLDVIHDGDVVLCMRNIDCYLISEQLSQRGFSVRLQAGGDKSELPIWLYLVFAGWSQELMSLELFRQKCQTLLSSDGEQEWHYLCCAGVVVNNNILVIRLVQSVEKYSVINSMTAAHQILVTTVHKAKGLQFPHVFFHSNKTHFTRKYDAMNTFYVAVTRAEQHFSILNDSTIKTVHSKPGGMYKVGQSLLLEGINEIDLKSLFPEPETLSSTHLEMLLRGEVEYFASRHEIQVWLFAKLNNHQVLRLYRMPRLEKITGIQGHARYCLKSEMAEMSTFVYSGDSEWIENIVGPTCFLPLPIFKGLWEIKGE